MITFKINSKISKKRLDQLKKDVFNHQIDLGIVENIEVRIDSIRSFSGNKGLSYNSNNCGVSNGRDFQNMRETLAHEIYHCFQFQENLDKINNPDSFFKGDATWSSPHERAAIEYTNEFSYNYKINDDF